MGGHLNLFPILLDIVLQDAVGAVIADHKLSGHVVPRCRPEGLDGVHGSAVAGKANHRFVGVGQLGPDRPRNPHPERTTPGQKVAIGLSNGEISGNRRGVGQRLVEDNRVLG